MPKYLSFTKILWQVNKISTGEFVSVHTSLVEASEVADKLGKDYDVWYCASYNPCRKEKVEQRERFSKAVSLGDKVL
jgi:hypothetical protein|tara:strand:+ start:783 stop:1013 length:231 start_codon:yes stop_codon:yes gene_type:complete